MYNAEVGRTAGGVVNVITKSGTNDFHGSAFEFFRNDSFDARNFFASSLPKPQLSQHQYGGSIGGPIARNKTFFFGDFEGFTNTQDVTAVATVPTVRMRAGDFSEVSTIIYDPTDDAANAVSRQRDSSGPSECDRAALPGVYPAPTSPGLANNYTGVRERTQDSKTADFRIDQILNQNNRLFARYSFNGVDTFTPPVFPVVDGIEGGGGGSFPGPNDSGAHGAAASYNTVFSPSLVGEFRGAYLKVRIASYGLNYGQEREPGFRLAQREHRRADVGPDAGDAHRLCRAAAIRTSCR